MSTISSSRRHTPRSAILAIGPRPVPADRRARLRLRELCDEVLASHRIAAERDLWTDEERAEAATLLGGLNVVGPRER